MQLPEAALSLRIFIGESDRHGHQPLYEFIVKQARELQMAGATVTRCPMGFGKSSRIHTEKILQLSMDLPIVIEIVDSEEKINGLLLPRLDDWLAAAGALVTLEKIKVLHYRARAAADAATTSGSTSQ
jgi:PII-like signaling protein